MTCLGRPDAHLSLSHIFLPPPLSTTHISICFQSSVNFGDAIAQKRKVVSFCFRRAEEMAEGGGQGK